MPTPSCKGSLGLQASLSAAMCLVKKQGSINKREGDERPKQTILELWDSFKKYSVHNENARRKRKREGSRRNI